MKTAPFQKEERDLSLFPIKTRFIIFSLQFRAKTFRYFRSMGTGSDVVENTSFGALLLF